MVKLMRLVDLGASGWYSGEMHAHTHHDPIHYDLVPEQSRMIAKAEGLNVLHLLDQHYEFTGHPHSVSDDETILFYTVEYRNGAYGHISVPGLTDMIPEGCCSDPAPAYPMLTDLRSIIVPTAAPMIVLSHPHTTDDYWNDVHWPGSGLGRELPVMAALGSLDALDIVSYSNYPSFGDLDDWYAILSAGLPCPPSAGTDCLMCDWRSRPVGCWRVYANLGTGRPLNYYEWLSALKSGRTFVTSYPLIEAFQVGAATFGDTIEHPDSVLDAPVHLRALCSMGLRRIAIVADGDEVWSANLVHIPPRTVIDTTIELSIPTPPWLLARVEGIVANPHAAIGQSLALTSPIRILRNGAPIRRTAPSGRLLDGLDSLQTFVTNRDNWDATWQRDSVYAKIDRARAYYRSAFVLPPGPFELTTPLNGDSVMSDHIVYAWRAAVDPEPGDRLSYDVYVARDTLFTLPRHYSTAETLYAGPSLPLGTWYWFVRANDRAMNSTRSTPPFASFVAVQDPSSAGNVVAPIPGRPIGFPNPSRDEVRLLGLIGPIAIFDAAGRRVAGSGDGVRLEGDALVWDGRIRGRPAPAGLYCVRGSGGGHPVRLIRIR